jgi:hypothetical protein
MNKEVKQLVKTRTAESSKLVERAVYVVPPPVKHESAYSSVFANTNSGVCQRSDSYREETNTTNDERRQNP